MGIIHKIPDCKKGKASGLKATFAALALGATPYFYQAMHVWQEIPEPGFETHALITVTGDNSRIVSALDMKGPETPLFVSGVWDTLTDTVFEEKFSARIGTEISLTADHITLGRKAKTTYGNAKEIAAWLNQNPDIQKITIISSSYHLPRLRLELERVLPEHIKVRYSACGDECKYPIPRTLSLYGQETIKTLGAFFTYSGMMDDIQNGNKRLTQKDGPAP